MDVCTTDLYDYTRGSHIEIAFICFLGGNNFVLGTAWLIGEWYVLDRMLRHCGS